MKNFKLFGGLLGVIILTLALVFFLNRGTFLTIYENRAALSEGNEWVEETSSLAGLIDYIEAHPGHVSLTSLNLTYPEQSVHYGEDQKRVLGAVSHLLLLGAWIEAQSEDLHPADSLIEPKSVERHHLPGVAEAAHRAAMNELRNATDDEDEVTLGDVAYTMIKHMHPASADYFYTLLGEDRIASFTRTHSGPDTDAPLPWSGYFIAAHPELHDKQDSERLESLESLSTDSLQNMVRDNHYRYINEPEFYERVVEAFGDDGHQLNFTEQRRLYNLMPRGTTQELARFGQKILEGEFINTELSDRMYEYLNWPLEEAATRRHFDRYGAVFNNRMSILGGMDFGESAYTNERYAQALLFDNMPIGLWMHMSSNFMNQDFQKRLIYDPELQRRAEVRLQK